MTAPKTLHKLDALAIKQILEFAAMEITAVRQVEEHLVQAAACLCARTGGGPHKRLRFKVLQPGQEAEYVNDQKTLNAWLEKIARWSSVPSAHRKTILAAIKTWVDKAQVTVTTEIENGQFRRDMQVEFNGVQSVVGEGLARFLSDHASKDAAILKCKICKTFFLRGRVDQKFCSVTCRVDNHRPSDTWQVSTNVPRRFALPPTAATLRISNEHQAS